MPITGNHLTFPQNKDIMNMKKVKDVPRKSLAERLKKGLKEGMEFARGDKELQNKRNNNGKPS